MKQIITFIVLLCFTVIAIANNRPTVYKNNSKNLKVSTNKIKKVKKISINRNNYCDTHTTPGGGIAYICFSDIPCQPSWTAVTCHAQPGGGSITTAVVYP